MPADPKEIGYEDTPIGRNTLSTMVKRMRVAAGIEYKQKSKHILRATGATAMFQSNVPEKVIQKQLDIDHLKHCIPMSEYLQLSTRMSVRFQCQCKRI